MNIKLFPGVTLALVLSAQAEAYNCSGVAQYVDGRSYTNNAVVQNAGNAFSCKVGGWCSIGGPYAPGTGWASAEAWTNLGSCGTTATSSAPRSSAGSSVAASAPASGGNCPNWAAGTTYLAGAVVRYNGGFYRAEHDNPGYDPVISTWFWEPTASCPGGTTTSSSSGNNATCAPWVAGRMYYTGNLVTYNGGSFRAKYDNPGYDPLISTWFWEPASGCNGTGTSSSVSNPGTGFSAVVSEAQFNQMFPGRNPFYTYAGLLEATKTYPAFAGTGDIQLKKREAAAALANFSHETGSFVHVTEIAKGLYCSDWGNLATCPCEPGKQYYGRGPIQLSHNGNYCAAGAALGLDLRRNPELVEQNAKVAWQTALWFWMTQSGAGYRPAHDSIVNNYGFGETIRTINGALECNGGNPAQVQSRINEYNRILQIIGGSAGNNVGC
jgi:predicted chitinase